MTTFARYTQREQLVESYCPKQGRPTNSKSQRRLERMVVGNTGKALKSPFFSFVRSSHARLRKNGTNSFRNSCRLKTACNLYLLRQLPANQTR
jgi:hypothetical protein